MNLREDIDFLAKRGIISEIISKYSQVSNELKNRIDISLIHRIIAIIKKKKRFESNNIDEIFDIGVIYKQEVPYEKRKELGEIYTPKKIVELILNDCGFGLRSFKDSDLIDLSCGSGSFLLIAIKRILYVYLEKFNKKHLSELLPNEARIIIRDIEERIYGIDINPIACMLAQLNIHILLIDLYKVILKKSKSFKPPLYKIYSFNSLKLMKNEFSSLPKTFDYIVGNPPYLFIRDIPAEHKKIIKSTKFLTKSGQYDYYQLFLELGIKSLKNGGKLGYIIPDSLLALSNRKVIRKYIYETTKINKIRVVGSQFENSSVSNIILILTKEKIEQKRKNNNIEINFHNGEIKKITQLPQKQIEKWNFKFLINLNPRDIEILNYLDKNFNSLGEISSTKNYSLSLTRGVELTKEGGVFYCKQCGKYYPIPTKKQICNTCGKKIENESIEEIILDNIPTSAQKSDYLPYIYSIQRYNITNYKYIDITKKGIRYKNLQNYDNRIIIRQIPQRGLICATLDPNKSLCSQSFYNLKILRSPIPEFNNHYLLGLLNSSLLSYFFLKSFGSYKELFPRILIEKIKSLPIKVPENREEKAKARKITKYVLNLLNLNHHKRNHQTMLQQKIDQLIYSLYGLEDYLSEYINNLMRENGDNR